jgi:hypothetical protein
MSTRKPPSASFPLPSPPWGSDPATSLLQGLIPSVEEMAPPPPSFHLVPQPKSPPKPQGLFQEMLHGDPQQLLEDAQQHGDDGMVTALLHALQTGTRPYADLHPEEQMLLDVATYEMLSRPPVKRKIERPFQHVKSAEADLEYREGGEYASPPVGDDNLPAFWWT